MIKNFIVVFVTLVLGLSTFAQKVEVRPYTIATTFEKYNKEYPFIEQIQSFASENVIAEEDIVYKKTAAARRSNGSDSVRIKYYT